jgi:hypothetical protein
VETPTSNNLSSERATCVPPDVPIASSTEIDNGTRTLAAADDDDDGDADDAVCPPPAAAVVVVVALLRLIGTWLLLLCLPSSLPMASLASSSSLSEWSFP